ncbi:MAG: CarD family transcriptional regulator, partial [Gaiellaceae bacterium]
MDRPARSPTPALAPLARSFAQGERLREFVERPADARVSEPLLPLFLAALHEARGGPLVCVLPDDAQARDAAEGAGWYLGEERVGLFASRGVRWGSGLEPPPHLVGERARALEILVAGGLVCASALGAAEGVAPEEARPEPIALGIGDEPGVDGLAERLALAGYERVPQAEERGQFAVRGGIVDIFPSTGREPVRVELFGDEIESLRAFSPFTQRTLHGLSEATVFPAAERRADLAEPTLPEDGEAPAVPEDLVAPLPAPDLVWQAEEVTDAVSEELGADFDLGSAVRLSQLPSGQPHAFEAQRPAVAARGLAEAERDLLGYVRAGNRVVVTFVHRGEALRTRGLLRRVEAVVLDEGDELPVEPGLVFAVSPARRGFLLRDLDLILLPDTQVFRKRPPRTDVRVGRALQSFADLRTGDHVVHEDHGVGRLLGFETKTVAGVTRDYLFLAFKGDDRLYVPHEQIAKVSRYVGADGHAPALSKLGGKAWQTIKNRARAGAQALAGELLVLYAQRQRAEGVAFEADSELVEQLEASFAYEETPDQRQAIES